MTIVLVAAYVPIGFQGGLTGALFTQFAFTLAGAVTISGRVALTPLADNVLEIFRAEQEEGRFGACSTAVSRPESQVSATLARWLETCRSGRPRS